MLVIPGRPQARMHASDGTPLAAGRRYYDHVQALARRAFGNTPARPTGQVPIRLELYYAFTDEQAAELGKSHATWHLQSIPSAATAPTIILGALAGHLYAHTSQVEPLTVTRAIVSHDEATATYGPACRRGLAIIHLEPTP